MVFPKEKIYDLKVLNRYINEKKIFKIDHPDLPISIYNYTRNTQYNNDWDEVTMAMRLTIIDDKGKVIAAPFNSKFFNYEEVRDKVPVKGDYVYVQEKLDGSLGLLFFYADKWHLATKRSFNSDIGIRGMEILRNTYTVMDQSFAREFSYAVEIICKESKNVVDYKNKNRVIFLSASMNGTELHWTTALGVFNYNGIKKKDIVKTEQHMSFGESLYNSLKDKNEKNKEGYVLRFQPDTFRMKIKYEEYVRLHSLLTGVSNIDIWKHLKDGRDISELLEEVPDEFDKWVKGIVRDLGYHRYAIMERCGKIHDYFRYGKYNDREPEPSKEDFIDHLDNYAKVEPKIRALGLLIWDRKSTDRLVWKMIRPKEEKTFWKK
jgi:RNA ligase